MTVRIDQLETEVVAEPVAAASGTAGGDSPWKELQRQRALAARVQRDRLRTVAEGTRD